MQNQNKMPTLMSHRTTDMATITPRKSRRRLLSLSAAAAVIAAVYVLGGPTVWAASAPIDSGSVTVVDPVVRTTEITNARSATEFSLQLPAGAACPGDSLHDQWRWQTFIIPVADDPGAIVYEVQGPSGPGQWPLFDTKTHPLVDEIVRANAAPDLPGVVPVLDALSFAVFPLLNSWRSFTIGCSKRCRSAASTSQSTITLFLASDANEAVRTLLPVPPLPLITTNCFIALLKK
jgi:hypothetical protein